MRQITIIILFLWILYPKAQAGEIFNNSVPEISQPATAGSQTPFSSGNNRPFRVVDPGDTGDNFGPTGGTDDTGNVNDNNTPIADGGFIIMLTLIAYCTVKKYRQIKK